jgi:predicted DNA-binding transcriptional regulator AlpA
MSNENTLFYSEPQYITEANAMKKLGFSRHTFDKCVKDGVLSPKIEGKTTLFAESEIDSFMQSEDYRLLDEGVVDARNPLNDLTGK